MADAGSLLKGLAILLLVVFVFGFFIWLFAVKKPDKKRSLNPANKINNKKGGGFFAAEEPIFGALPQQQTQPSQIEVAPA